MLGRAAPCLASLQPHLLIARSLSTPLARRTAAKAIASCEHVSLGCAALSSGGTARGGEAGEEGVGAKQTETELKTGGKVGRAGG